jgi:ATP-dependent DNA helicase RecG
MRPDELNGAVHYDISPVEGGTIKDLNLDVIREYFLKYNAFDLYV